MDAQPEAQTKPRIGLVLGAGGVVGASYMAGALEGIRRATGWEPSKADILVGTSAGAFIVAVAAVGIPTALMYMRCTGDAPDGPSFSAALMDLSERMDRHNEGHWMLRYLPAPRLPRPLLASPRMAFEALRKGRFPMLLAGLLGEGVLSTERSFGAVVRTALAHGWTSQEVWIVAYDLDGGHRVVFGSPHAPATDLHRAVAAATAVPCLFAPVVIGGRRYCDAGLCSPSNLDVVRGLGLDVVVCINPLSRADEPVLRTAGGPVERSVRRLGRIGRRRIDRKLAAERRILEREGTKVYVIHPRAEDIAFPLNSMDLESRPRVMRHAARTTAQWLSGGSGTTAELAALLRRAASLKPGK
jgi:NTE family protein